MGSMPSTSRLVPPIRSSITLTSTPITHIGLAVTGVSRSLTLVQRPKPRQVVIWLVHPLTILTRRLDQKC
jgi:hypothetical protein